MSRPCSVCVSSEAGAINDRLRDGIPASTVAAEYGLEPRSVQRHAKDHLARLATAASAAVDRPATALAVRDPLDELAEALRVRALAGDPVVAREYRLAVSAVQARQAATAAPLDLAATAEWIDLRTSILRALAPYPDARQAVADAIA